MYFLTALACAIISIILFYFFKDRKNLHLDILALTYSAATLMWFVDCVFSAINQEGFLSFEDEIDGWISLATIVGGILFWLVLSFILNNSKKQTA